MPEQTFKNHGRIVPAYHAGVFFPFLINFVWRLYQLRYGISGGAIVDLLVAIALLLMFFSVRLQILTVQDRVIRLEMRLRLRELLPAEECVRAASLPIKQLVALRFASDAELPALLRDVVSGELATQKAIKMRVKHWQADHLRA
jgi:hypothetical protein